MEEEADELARLRLELWQARDAAIGATAELGTARARIAELETTLEQYRDELAKANAELGSRPVRLARAVAGPLRRLKRSVT